MSAASSAPARRSFLATSAAAGALGLMLLAAPSHAQTVTHAESQLEWLQKQLRFTDGYTPEASTVVPGKNDGNTSRTDTKTAGDAAGGTGYVGASKEVSAGDRLTCNPKNYYNGFSPYASDRQLSAP